MIADTFSRMPMQGTVPLAMVGKDESKIDPFDCHFLFTDDREMTKCFVHLPEEECYLNLPPDSMINNPLDMDAIKEQQDADNELQNQAGKYADCYTRKRVNTVDDVLCYVKPGNPPANWKIALPRSILQPTICWFHEITGHPGSKRLHMQVSSCYYHHDLQCLIDKHKCDHCQRYKLDGKGYGHLPECKICSMSCEERAVDLIGPWTIQVQDKPFKFNALTMIDSVLNLVKLVRIDDKTSAHIAKKYAQVWLTRYPWPARCIHNNGGKFIEPEFHLFLEGC